MYCLVTKFPQGIEYIQLFFIDNLALQEILTDFWIVLHHVTRRLVPERTCHSDSRRLHLQPSFHDGRAGRKGNEVKDATRAWRNLTLLFRVLPRNGFSFSFELRHLLREL